MPHRLPMIIIRFKKDTDNVAEIVSLATDELRRVYRCSVNSQDRPDSASRNTAISLVAIKDQAVVGTVEYFDMEDSLYVRGLAVHPQHRLCGIAAALVREVEKIALREGKSQVTLSTIKETGNPDIFANLGYTIIKESPATGYEDLDGRPVTRVDMCHLLS